MIETTEGIALEPEEYFALCKRRRVDHRKLLEPEDVYQALQHYRSVRDKDSGGGNMLVVDRDGPYKEAGWKGGDDAHGIRRPDR